MKQALRESLWLPGVILVCGVAIMFILLRAADGAAPGSATRASYPPPSSPCTYAPIVGVSFGHALEAAASAEEVLAPAASYPPPSSPCSLRNKRLYTPIIWNDAR